jgi:L,D-peptidoglycan transpeptidase YkuD (ErfK/YbiS/YcfS/YnhG family)
VTQAVVFPDGRFIFNGEPIRCAMGRAGITAHKQEGDHATPSGVLALRRVLYRADRLAIPAAAVPREPISPHDCWCDDIYHAAYNTRVTLPFEGRHEILWRDDDLYDVIGVLGWNDAPVVRSAGSAIFLHVARRDLSPTEGCIALPLPTLLRVLRNGLTSLEILG